MKELERNPLPYLGHEMYTQWQQCLQDDTIRKERHEKRKEKRRRIKERKLLQLQRDLQLIQERKQQGEESRRSSVSGKRSSFSSNISDNHPSRRNSNFSKHTSSEDSKLTTLPMREDKSFDSNDKSNSPFKNQKVFHTSHPILVSNATTPSSIINRSKSASNFSTSDKTKSATNASSKKLWNMIITTKRQSETLIASYTHHSSHVAMLEEDGIGSDETPKNDSISRSLSYPNISSLNSQEREDN